MKEFEFTYKDNMTSSQIKGLYHKVVNSGFEEYLFYDGGIRSVVDWYDFISLDFNWLVEVKEEGVKPAGMFWLNGHQGRTAQVHFCTWREFKDKAAAMRASLAWMKGLGYMKSLYGCTPKTFTHVIKLIQSVGLKKIGEIPAACYMYKQDEYVPGVITVVDFNDIEGD